MFKTSQQKRARNQKHLPYQSFNRKRLRGKFAPERSWSKLKTAINIWMKGQNFENPPLYEIIAYDLQKAENSVMRTVIGLALEKHSFDEDDLKRREELKFL